MLALQKLEEQAQNESSVMREIAEKTSQDSTSVRILTIIMLVYLPCTVVSVCMIGSIQNHANGPGLLFNTVCEPKRARDRRNQHRVHSELVVILCYVDSANALYHYDLVRVG